MANQEPIAVVTGFFTALEELDIDKALTFAAPGIVYQNVPLPPARGIDAVGKQLRLLSRFGTGFEARMHHIAANGDVVLTERTDVLRAGSWEAAFWVCGSLEMVDGRIALWRDYFDFGTVFAAGVRGAWKAVRAKVSARR